MRYVYPIPGDVLYWASAIHVGAMVLLAIKLLDHVRYVVAPSRWSLFVSMLTGWLPGASRPSSEPAPTPQAVSAARSKEAV
jgi:hypothetical protein